MGLGDFPSVHPDFWVFVDVDDQGQFCYCHQGTMIDAHRVDELATAAGTAWICWYLPAARAKIKDLYPPKEQ